MEPPLNASATSVGTLLKTNSFVVPPFQREYAWESEEVREFWQDLKSGLVDESYFLGLVILTQEGAEEVEGDGRSHVVDGQQRILTVSLLAAAIHHEAVRAGRKALADLVKADFLTSINYQTDEVSQRVVLSSERDNDTFQALIASSVVLPESTGSGEFSKRLVQASKQLREFLANDLRQDPFKRLGRWAEFLTNEVYVAVFLHPDPASAYRVFEVINTRGRELTTADLLKSFVLSQTPPKEREKRYDEWLEIARPLSPQSGASNLVQFIRHVVTLEAGHVPPRDLFAFLAERTKSDRIRPPSVNELMSKMQDELPLYLQIVDPTVAGPGEDAWLEVFAAFDHLGVITVRPLLMAIAKCENASEGMEAVLRLVVRRIVVGNLGTGSVERRLSEAARRTIADGRWEPALGELADLNPGNREFTEQLRKRSYNKSTLTFLHRSIVQSTLTPDDSGFLHLIRPRQASDWSAFPDEEFTFWGSTIGNSVLASQERRPKGALTWQGFRDQLLPLALGTDSVLSHDSPVWDANKVEERGRELADVGTRVWGL